MSSSLNLRFNALSCVCAKLLAGIIVFVTLLLLLSVNNSPFSLLSNLAILMPSSMHLMKISNSIVKFYGVGITFPFLSMKIACMRPEIRVFSRMASKGYVHM